jgi:DNA-binding response OmpR family regulator
MTDREKALIATVDDEAMHLRIIVSQLQQAQYRVQPFSSALELFGWMAAGNIPHLILMDFKMPVMDGIVATSKIREKFSRMELPIILFATGQQIHDLIRSFESGANDFLHQPMDKYELLARIKMHLQAADWYQRMDQTVAERSRMIRSLLDFAQDGFLYLDPDLIIRSEHSRSAGQMTGIELKNKSFAVLFPERRQTDILTSESILHKVMAEQDEQKCKLFLELLPATTTIAGRLIKLSYFVESHQQRSKRVLIQLQDITLQETRQREMQQHLIHLQMITSVLKQSKSFYACKERFEQWILHEWNSQRAKDSGIVRALESIGNQIVYFQEAWGQFHFLNTVSSLQQMGDQIQKLKQSMSSRSDPFTAWEHWLERHSPIDCLREDLEWLERNLGPVATKSSDELAISMTSIHTFEQRLYLIPDPVLRELLIQEYHRLYFRPVSELVLDYEDFLSDLAVQAGKLIHPVQWKGLHLLIDQRRFQLIFQLLHHLFRNIVEHAIETLDGRILAQKPEFATVKCDVTLADDELLITLEDDGRGLPLQQLRQKLISRGLFTAEHIRRMGDDWLAQQIFEIGMTSKDYSGPTSIRPNGLSLVKKEAEALGGHVYVQTKSGQGTLIMLWIPLTP